MKACVSHPEASTFLSYTRHAHSSDAQQIAVSMSGEFSFMTFLSCRIFAQLNQHRIRSHVLNIDHGSVDYNSFLHQRKSSPKEETEPEDDKRSHTAQSRRSHVRFEVEMYQTWNVLMLVRVCHWDALMLGCVSLSDVIIFKSICDWDASNLRCFDVFS